ncbi:molybdopterin-dependent oxidoreductase [Phenylobacterium kunshanense]|uniref:Molybdopterin-binding protein n=1 Tax=Phenylobacterium kunshanense TaxID=1445034 RepID=A0A328BQU2_9CAUL|nr:molybdopterin-dependent oxidoreductase [Phenylobacterium kunshanense]RAK67438.1 molybdopterin-binding protein [Phenylobacterium kunshanense]
MTLDRRRWLSAAGAALGSAWLAGCDRLATNSTFTGVLRVAERWTKGAQRLVTDRNALAREFSRAEISRDFRANGTLRPQDPEYVALVAENFAGYRLVIDGLVEQPLALTLAEVRAAPARTQVTRHDCVEGWSSIGEWTGARLSALLDRARLKPEARYIVLHCADTLDPYATDGAGRYYESIDLVDAYHPQTILAYAMNGATLPVRHGAPLRLRVERQLGYKHAKYVMRVEAVASLEGIGRGQGGFWPDRGYEWYAGI